VKRILACRPSPATVISCIALFVALGGVSYGVATGSIDSREITDNTIRSKDIRNNSVYTRDLRNNDVRGLDIRNNTIRGRDVAPNTLTDDQIDESKLAQVPSAVTATQLGGIAASEYARSRAEAVHAADLAPGVTATGGGFLVPGYWRDTVGTVHLQGSVEGATGTILTLPAGYRPEGTARYLVPGATIEVATTGIVSADTGGGSISLDGVTFRAAP